VNEIRYLFPFLKIQHIVVLNLRAFMRVLNVVLAPTLIVVQHIIKGVVQLI